MTTIIDGNMVADKVKARATEMVTAAAAKGVSTHLAVVLVGDDPASASYVRMKRRDCEKCGIVAHDEHLPEDSTQETVDALIDGYNSDPQINGILVQMPVPGQLDPERIISRISPEKDVDGFNPENLGRLVRGTGGFESCTPKGVMMLLEEYGIPVEGKHAVIIGRSNIVGKPMALMMLRANATVTVCHSHTRGLVDICREADILISAIGRPRFITAEFVKPGATVIDVGINRTDDGLVGDVDFASVEPLASAITPVPGGVGPMTRAVLMYNTALAASRKAGLVL